MTRTVCRPSRHRAVLAALGVAVLVAAACSGSDDREASGETTETSSTVAAGTEDTAADGHNGDDDRASSTTAADSGSTDTPTSDESTPRASEDGAPQSPEVSAELASDCVVPGGTQTITIRSEPRISVGYQTVYADGTKGSGERTFTNPGGEEGYGGNNGGLTDESGRWKDTWTISPEAPEGPADVHVFARGQQPEMGRTVVRFALAGPLGSCE